MTTRITKTIAAALTALTLGGAVLTTSAPADARPIVKFYPKWSHWGGGYRYGWGGYGYGWGAAGLAGGVVLGTIAARTDHCGYVRQPIYDTNEDFLGYLAVSAC